MKSVRCLLAASGSVVVEVVSSSHAHDFWQAVAAR